MSDSTAAYTHPVPAELVGLGILAVTHAHDVGDVALAGRAVTAIRDEAGLERVRAVPLDALLDLFNGADEGAVAVHAQIVAAASTGVAAFLSDVASGRGRILALPLSGPRESPRSGVRNAART